MKVLKSPRSLKDLTPKTKTNKVSQYENENDSRFVVSAIDTISKNDDQNSLLFMMNSKENETLFI